MVFKIIFLEEFGKAFVPKKAIPNLRSYMLKAGFNEVPYRFFGLLFYFSALITTLIFIIFLFPFLNQNKFSLIEIYGYAFLGWFLIQLFFVTIFVLIIYFFLDFRIYIRTKNMEEQLPDFLQILSANLKGGMTFERALWSAIKPRFDVLGSEMAKASKKVMTGYDTSKALTELSEKYDSPMLRRTVDLIISEVESGGNVAELIDRIVDNLKETKILKQEMAASAIAYVIFISVIVVVISPLLFALSFHLLEVLTNFIDKLSFTTQSVRALPFAFSKASIETQDFRIFSLIALFVISLFSSLIVAIVEKGEIKGGVKYIPIYVFGAMGFYFLFMKILGSVFTGIV
ncbi:hypothetical protein CMO83_03780 [Candidatus Woesearchaeota archaeon]|jgi:hypothetical protein|nr:hypothetical protein [Candidatus Woesearchaeota archaeon]|tara:strand:+ start:11868 stop:12899 length:1032 start_codon:yes stop_codon:yes gene_type:complete